jgi:hypothetical protein
MDFVKSGRDTAEDRQTNLVISPEVLRFSRQTISREIIGRVW